MIFLVQLVAETNSGVLQCLKLSGGEENTPRCVCVGAAISSITEPERHSEQSNTLRLNISVEY